MKTLHNLGTVFGFEVVRMLRKKSFWAMALGFPVMMAVVFGIVFWSNSATQDAVKELSKQQFKVAITDEARLIKPELLTSMGIQPATSKQQAIDDIKQGRLDGYVHIPANLQQQKVEIHGQDVGIFKNNRYHNLAELLLKQSVSAELNELQRAVMDKQVQFRTTTYRDGVEHSPIREMIVPGFFLVLFYMLIGFFGGQMLTSTVEEKENRTVEMLLTTVQSRTLIIGKILAMVMLAVIQGAVIVAPVLLLYFLAGDRLQLPSIGLESLVFDPLRIGLAAVIFGLGFMMFTGLLVAVGAMMPTAKEASSWSGVVFLLIFAPLYGIAVFVSYPESLFVQFFSYFPLTAPIPLLLRNAVGNLQLYEALIAIGILAVTTVAVMLLAVRLFRYGAMAYDSKLSLAALRTKRTTTR